jgi:hypothetical protein
LADYHKQPTRTCSVDWAWYVVREESEDEEYGEHEYSSYPFVFHKFF